VAVRFYVYRPGFNVSFLLAPLLDLSILFFFPFPFPSSVLGTKFLTPLMPVCLSGNQPSVEAWNTLLRMLLGKERFIGEGLQSRPEY
jgi:hypothetical protein